MKVPIIHWTLEYTLRFLGFWPTSWNPLTKILLCSTLVTISPFQLWEVISLVENKTMMLDGFRDMVTLVLLVVKFIIMCFNNSYVRTLILELADDWENFKSDEDKKIMMQYVKYAHKFCICTWWFYSSTSSAYFIQSLLSLFTSQEKVLIIPVTYPFDYHSSPTFEIVNLFQAVLFILWVNANCLSETLLATLTFHLVGKIKLLMKDITDMPLYNTPNKRHLIKFIKSIVRKHRKLINMRHKIEAVYSYICLIQFFSSTILLCVTGFLIVSSKTLDTMLLTKLVLFGFLMLWQSFAFCFSGEFLLTMSSHIPQCIGDSPWYEMEPKYVNLLLFIIKRTQDPLHFTMGKFATLSIHSFTTILQTSASYISVLRTAY